MIEAEMTNWIETYKGAVQVAEYDSEAHMNTQMYVTRFDQATWFLLGAVGVTPGAMKDRNLRIAIVRQQFQYQKELAGGELLYIESGFIAVGRKYLRLQHRMYNAESNEMVATADYTAVQADKESAKTVAIDGVTRKAAEARLIADNKAAE